MSRATIELDFFGIEKQNKEKHSFEKSIDQKITVRGMQNAISRIDPQLLKSLITTGVSNLGLNRKSLENSLSSKEEAVFRQNNPIPIRSGNRILTSALPVMNHVYKPVVENPLTIFYNGTVSVFDVPRDQGERIIKMAENGNVGAPAPADSSGNGRQLLERLNGVDLPIARKHSLQRFLLKRRERLSAHAPYSSGAHPQEDKKKFMESIEA
ncbi:protein TIFY 9-like [Tasmannia lanceolata]|uniref:protein TIFY 9-like n=1 Tax=Tasmannia lanceolata TaxID=3420 RepID=UPI004062D0FA